MINQKWDRVKIEDGLIDDMAYLPNLPRIPLIRILRIILERLRARKLMVTRRGRANIALTGDLSRKACHGTGHYDHKDRMSVLFQTDGCRFMLEAGVGARAHPTLIDLAEDHDARESSIGIARDGGVVDIDSWEEINTGMIIGC